MASLLELYGDRPLSQLLADDRPVPLSSPTLEWLECPPEDFRRYLLNRPVLSFESVPPSPQHYKRDVTFSIVQMHRMWVTTKLLKPHLPGPNGLVVDLGAFPFPVEQILRDYLGFGGRLCATVNLPLQPAWEAELKQYRVETAMLNLDPFVVADAEGNSLPERLDLPDGSADLVIFAHVIEHLYHPMHTLREAFRLLRPGGKLLISTDNSFMLATLLNYATLNPFLNEPVEQMAPMSFTFWRGHNRFFSATDLSTMMQHVGFRVTETALYEIFYSSFSDDHFHHPVRSMPAWRADILTKIPGYRNEVMVIGEKP